MNKFGASAYLILASSLFLAGCAHPYTLDPLGGKPESLNGVTLSTVSTSKCVFQAGYQYSNSTEMLVKIRVTNKGKSAFEVDSSAFTMNGPKETLKSSPLAASDPDKFLKELSASAELADSRTHMESYQGVEDLGAFNSTDSDITAAKKSYENKVSEADSSRKQAEAIRKRIAIIAPAALRKTNVKSGETAEGGLIFKAAFGETGVVTIESSLATCPAKLQFMLKK